MASYNKVFLIGNLTRDPEIAYLPSQTAATKLSIATNRRWTGQDGAKKEETCFVNCTAFGQMAEVLNKYMKKGMPIFIEGRLNYHSWTTQDGSKRSELKVIIEKFEFLPSGKKSQESNNDSFDKDYMEPPF
ncbi:MAG: single-stranded DNA-binding protein [Planctomycetota bacterium]|jgi:single-strand DNA-binding protein